MPQGTGASSIPVASQAMMASPASSQREVPGKHAPHPAPPMPSSLQVPAVQVAAGISSPVVSQVRMTSPSQRLVPGSHTQQLSARGVQPNAQLSVVGAPSAQLSKCVPAPLQIAAASDSGQESPTIALVSRLQPGREMTRTARSKGMSKGRR